MHGSQYGACIQPYFSSYLWYLEFLKLAIFIQTISQGYAEVWFVLLHLLPEEEEEKWASVMRTLRRQAYVFQILYFFFNCFVSSKWGRQSGFLSKMHREHFCDWTQTPQWYGQGQPKWPHRVLLAVVGFWSLHGLLRECFLLNLNQTSGGSQHVYQTISPCYF